VAGQPDWIVLTTLPLMERRAYGHIVDQGMTAYLPIYRRTEVRSSKSGPHISMRPCMLFQGYMFAQIGRGWQSLASTVGVKGILRFGSEIATLPHAEIEKIKAKEDREGYVIVSPPPSRFAVGEKVKVTEGPLSSRAGVVDGPSAAMGRIRVLMSMLGRKTIVELNEAALEAA